MVVKSQHVIDFLREKGLLNESSTQFVIRLNDGKEFDMVKLFEEYASEYYDEHFPGE